jgi:membrane-associated phospholipid phosphatase
MTARLLPAMGVVCAVGFAATLVVALHTSRGLHDDGALFRHVYGNAALPVRAAGAARTLLLGIDVALLATGVILVASVAAAQRRLSRALAAVAVVICSVGSAEALKHGLPHLDSVIPGGRPPTIPSGHTSIAVSLGLAVVLVAPPVLRPAAALVGAAYAAAVGLSVIVLGWHYPADVIGAFFVCGFWAAAIASVMGRRAAGPAVSAAGALAAAVTMACALLLAAWVASRHPAGVVALRSARSVVATGVVLGALSLTMFGTFVALVGERNE